MSDYFDPEKKKDTCLILHNAVSPLTTLLVSEVKMAAQIPQSKVSDALKAFFSGKSPRITLRLGKCLIKVRIHCLLYLNLDFFKNYAIFLKLCDQMRFEVNCAKLHHRVISDGLLNDLAKAKGKAPVNIFFFTSNKKRVTITRKSTWSWACNQLKTSKYNLSAGNFNMYPRWVDNWASETVMILFSDYPVLTAVNSPQHGCDGLPY